jgi:cell division protein FtsQ
LSAIFARMARRNTSTLPEEDFEAVESPRAPSRSYEESPLDSRMLDLDEEGESPFLRGQKRVPVRRGVLPRKAADRIKLLLVLLLILGALGLVSVTLYRYATQSWRFRMDSSDNIEIQGMRNVTRSQVMDALGADIDRNIFFVSLNDQKKQLESIPWVESASVMRLLPNRLRIQLLERVPVAFVNINGRIAFLDAHGVIMETPPGTLAGFSFPVVVGMSDNEPLSTRAARMKIYNQLVRELDSTGAHYSQQLSEVDLSDPDDVKVIVDDPKGAVLIHLGASHFLERFRIFVAHIQEWRTQFARVDSVDLRYDGQVIMNPDTAAARAKHSGFTAETAKPQPEAVVPAIKHSTPARKKGNKKH